jgi:RNA polymerase sigma-70 factor (ECF subfamily)
MTLTNLAPGRLKLLVEGSAVGDTELFGELYDSLYDRVLMYVYKRTYDMALSQDIVSNVFYCIMTHIEKFRWRDESGWYAWVFQIARNEIASYGRKVQKVTQVDDWSDHDQLSSDTRQGVFESVEQSDRYEHLKAHVNTLKPKYRELVELYYFADLSHEVIAKTLGISPGSARVRLHRAVEILTQAMKGDGYEY